MNPQPKWMEYKGRKILYVDVRKATGDEFVAVLDRSKTMLWAQPSKVLYLGNIEDSTVSKEVMDWIKTNGPDTGRARMEKLAVVGASGVKKVFMDVVQLVLSKVAVPARGFKTEQEALDWLVQ
jgi:hypothetical protein